ncbi:outer membrane lipoprotein chaperone LolA [Aestuariibacter sp. AA17]|uniref:Outer-membrane lipoprotein carrier protein n=1 Tax=Fluctibacter corallii TaxID=2984329 RepID=A0ABT3A5X5_9ALTE|nr:outer membrane lipoprotein chaperone LolA [Aestuariibacter sp. AA17]MCV2884076.1 outer membrane lipoprotein chaperone LolA [Aestuariibacter sp. AA17]
MSYKRMINVSVFALSVAFSVMAHADLAAQALKDKLSKLSTYQAEFTQTVLDEEQNLLQEAQGKIAILRPNRLYWETYSPSENTLIADGEAVWHIDPFVEQVVAISQQQAVVNNPVMLLSSNDDSVWETFKVTQPSKSIFDVYSLDENALIKRLVLHFDDTRLVKLIFVDSQSQKSVLSFSDVNQNSDISPSIFDFTLPEGYDLDDQRGQ